MIWDAAVPPGRDLLKQRRQHRSLLGNCYRVLGFICAVVRRSACVKLAADKAGVHSCTKESGKDRAFWRGGEGGIFNFVISLS